MMKQTEEEMFLMVSASGIGFSSAKTRQSSLYRKTHILSAMAIYEPKTSRCYIQREETL
jgi:hypothetical protein